MRGVVDKVHRFDKPEICTAMARRTVGLDPCAFNTTNPSMPFKLIAGTDATPDWYSSRVLNSAVLAADHTLMRDGVRCVVLVQ